jgi:hypothetical protein
MLWKQGLLLDPNGGKMIIFNRFLHLLLFVFRLRCRPSKFTGIPVLGMCCVLLLCFLIAVIIVLALIPLYLPKKTLQPGTDISGHLSARHCLLFAATTGIHYLSGDLNGTLTDDLDLDDEGRSALARSVNRLSTKTSLRNNEPSLI